MKHALVKKIPTLAAVIPDAQAADRLRELVRDADSGLRRVLKCGLYIEWLAASLPHGKLVGWIEAHCPDVSERTVYNWRTLSRSVCEWVGLKFATIATLGLSGDKLIELPLIDLPAQARPYREKIDALLAEHKNAKQLFLALSFKQGQLDPETGTYVPKVGRRRGEGGKPAAPTGTIEEIVAYRQKASRREMGKAADYLEKVGVDFMGQDDAYNTALLSVLDRSARCLRAWLDTPPGKRDMKAVEKLWKTL